MKAVLLAGGLGTRLRPLTHTRLKALLPLAGRTMIDIVLEQAWEVADEVVVAASYEVDALRDHLSSLGGDVTLVPEESPMGTGGALRNVSDRLDGTFVVLNGDVVTTASLAALVDDHRKSGARATIALTRVEDPSGFGVIEVEDSMEVRSFVEKPPPGEAASDLVNAGIYVMEEEVTRLIPPNPTVSLEREVFPRLVGDGLRGHVLRGDWSDAGTLHGYLAAQSILLAKGASCSRFDGEREDTRVTQPVHVPPDAEVAGSAIGPNVSLGRGCRVTGASLRESALFDYVRVDPGATVEGSVLGAGVRCRPGSEVRDSIVADGCTIGEGDRVQGKRVASS